MVNDKKKCPKCSMKFSAYLISAHITEAGQEDCCPLCALKFKNKLFGLPPETLYTNPIARERYEEALKEKQEEEAKKQRKSELKVRARIKNKNEKTK